MSSPGIFKRSKRRFGTKLLAVQASIIKDTDTGEGRVVQTTRDDKGQVLSTEVMSLHEVEKSGLPLPTNHFQPK